MAAEENGGWADSIEELAQRRHMDVTLPSGAKVTLRTVTLDELVADEALPENLVYIAVLEGVEATVPEMARQLAAGGEEGSKRVREMSRDLLAMRERLCARALVGYENDQAEQMLAQLDGYDKEMIAEFAQRKTVVDAAGRRFGADSLERFRGADPEPAGDTDGAARGSSGVVVPEVQP